MTSWLLGRATELRLQAEAIERGYEVAVPVLDYGHDLVINGLRVQIKGSAVRLNGKGGAKSVHFTFRRGIDTSKFDIAAFYASPTGVWWFIPSSELTDEAKGVSLSIDPPSARGRPNKYFFHRFQNDWGQLAVR